MKLLKAWSVVLLSVLIFTACNEEDEEPIAAKVTENGGIGKAGIYITDAPVDNANISAVYISINAIEANGPEGWTTIKQFAEPMVVDLLSYQNGDSYLLAEEDISATTYHEIRLDLDIAGADSGSGSGSYIEYADGTKKSLFVPGSGHTGYKAVGDFTVEQNGHTGITLDFDVRKAIVAAENGEKYILKPAIRMASNDESGMIKGKFEADAEFNRIVVLAYEDGTFEETEMDEPKAGEVRFANAFSSNPVNNSNEFTLAFMPAGKYDLYFAMYNKDGQFLNVLGTKQDVAVSAQGDVQLDIKVGELN